MSTAKSVASLVPGLMSLSLVAHTTKVIPKDWTPKGMKKVKPGELIGNFSTTMIGIPMVGIVSNQVAALP